MWLLAGEPPEEAVAFAGIMMQQRLVAIHALLNFHRTHAHAADILDAAVLDEADGDVERLVDVGGVLRIEAGHGGEQLPPGADLSVEAVEPLRGAEIQVEIAARIKLRRDLGEAGFFHGNGGGSIGPPPEVPPEGVFFLPQPKLRVARTPARTSAGRQRSSGFFHDERMISIELLEFGHSQSVSRKR